MARKMDTKLMKVADEFADFDLLKPKDRSSTHFQTQETNSMFILTAQLKGYRRTNIKVERNDDERIITISGEKPFQDKLVIGGEVVKKDIEMRRFRKSFKVPQAVVLDKINARYNENYSEVIIQMPKATKRIMGVGIEELKTADVQTKSTKLVQLYTDGELLKQEIPEIEEDNVQNLVTNLEGKSDHKPRSENKLQANESQEDEFSSDNKENDSKEQKSAQRKFKICTPVIFGSALFLSLIVLVFHLVQSEKPAKQQKKKDQD